jgi:hypothetical protein
VTDRDWVGAPVNPASQPGMQVVLPDGTTEVHCALLQCLWVHREPPTTRWQVELEPLPPGRMPTDRVPDRIGAAITAAVVARHKRIEQELHDHLAGHDPVEWVTELVEARRERTDLIRSTVATVELALRGEGVTRDTRERVVSSLLYGHPDGRHARMAPPERIAPPRDTP